MRDSLQKFSEAPKGTAVQAETGQILWRLAADEMKTDEQHLQVDEIDEGRMKVEI